MSRGDGGGGGGSSSSTGRSTRKHPLSRSQSATTPEEDEDGKARVARDITPQDVPKLAKLKLTDYAADFSNIQLPKGEKLTGEDLQNVFDSFIQQVTT